MRVLKVDKLQKDLKLDIEDRTEVKKTLFIYLLVGSAFLGIALLFSLWLVPFVGLKNIHPLAPWIWGGIVGLGLIFILWSCSVLLLNIFFKRQILFSSKVRGIIIKLFFPFMLFIGKMFSIPQSKIRASFIKINNDLVISETKRFPSGKILILIPHCLQNSKCKVRLTYNIENCKRCGMCPIAYILELRDKYGVELAIATGGTIARRIVVQKRPKFIIAVACERDLASGIQDTYPLPVYGILNQRPYGPCVDTQVPLELLERAIKRFVA